MAKKTRKTTPCTTCNKSPVIQQVFQTRGLSLRPLRRQAGVLDNLLNRSLQYAEDLRQTPQTLSEPRQYKRIDGSPAEYGYRVKQRGVLQNRMFRMQPFLQLQFYVPQKTAVCVRRKTRRSVLFAMRRAGRAGYTHRRPRWSAKSYISCK